MIRIMQKKHFSRVSARYSGFKKYLISIYRISSEMKTLYIL